MKTILVDAINCFVIESNGSYKIFDEMFKVLETFSNKKIILTSAEGEKYKAFGLDKMPYEVFTLKHNPEKTDPKYYKMLLSRFRLKPDQVIYFEHGKDAVKSAESVGIKTYLYDNDKKDLVALKKFLEENLK